MFKIDTEQSLLNAFRPRDRKAVQLPPEPKFPMIGRDCLAWTDPTGFHVYLVFAVAGGPPTGIAFRREQSGEGSGSRMCEWCHSYGSADQIGLLTTDLNSKKRVGINVCLDLGCRAKLENAADLSGRNFFDLSKRMLERVGRFASEGLRIDLSGGGRD